MIFLLVGPDRYLLERELKRILAEHDPDGLNTTRYDTSASLREITSAAATSGFFADSRVIIAEGLLKRIADFKNRANDNPDEGSKLVDSEGDSETDVAKDVTELLGSVAPGNTLILVDPNVSTVPAAIRKAAGPDALQYGGGVPRGHDLVEWVTARVAEDDGQIAPKTIRAILDRLFPGDWQQANKNAKYDNPPDLLLLLSELAKLVTAADGKEINARHVKELVPAATGEDLFPFIDAVVGGNAAGAFKLLSGDETDDGVAARFLAQLGTNAELGQAVAGVRGDAALADAGKHLGGAKRERLAAVQRTFARTSAESFAKVVLESDRRLKTGKTRSPSEQLQEVIIRQARKTRGQ
jgi:DNA polymerase III delta subunit